MGRVSRQTFSVAPWVVERRIKQRELGYREHQVLEYALQMIEERGVGPSYGMIRDEYDIEKSNVCKIVKRLESKGFLKRIGSGRTPRIRLAS